LLLPLLLFDRAVGALQALLLGFPHEEEDVGVLQDRDEDEGYARQDPHLDRVDAVRRGRTKKGELRIEKLKTAESLVEDGVGDVDEDEEGGDD